jgi:PAS domain S-box-containing protein
MLHSINPEGRLISVSDHWLEVLGYQRDEVVGRPLFDFLDPESRRCAREEVLPEFFRSGFCKDVSYRLIRRDGGCLDVLLSAIGDRDETGRIVRSLAVSIDISERLRAEDELRRAQQQLSLYTRDLEEQVRLRTAEIRRLSGAIMAAQERERAAIARGLHDELGQVLTALRLEAAWLEERLRGGDAKAADRAQMMLGLIDDTIDEIRSIALRLRPRILDDLGLVAALEWLAADFERRTGITCTFVAVGEVPQLDETLATAAYRITQEALTNVARHAGAEQVDVRFTVAAGRVVIVIADDGSGFDPGKLAPGAGLGLAGMRERAVLVGGTLEVISRPGRGARVRFRVEELSE